MKISNATLLTLVCAVIIKDHARLFMAVDWHGEIQFLADAQDRDL